MGRRTVRLVITGTPRTKVGKLVEQQVDSGARGELVSLNFSLVQTVGENTWFVNGVHGPSICTPNCMDPAIAGQS